MTTSGHTRHRWATLCSMVRERASATLSPLVTKTKTVVATVWVAVSDSWRRHADKAATDPAYARTLAEAVSAVVRTMVTRSAVAAAIVVFATAVLVPDGADAPEDDEAEPYRGSRSWRPTPAAQPLWERFPDE